MNAAAATSQLLQCVLEGRFRIDGAHIGRSGELSWTDVCISEIQIMGSAPGAVAGSQTPVWAPIPHTVEEQRAEVARRRPNCCDGDWDDPPSFSAPANYGLEWSSYVAQLCGEPTPNTVGMHYGIIMRAIHGTNAEYGEGTGSSEMDNLTSALQRQWGSACEAAKGDEEAAHRPYRARGWP